MNAPSKTPLLVNAPYHMVKQNLERLFRLGAGVEVFFANNIIDEIDRQEVKELGRQFTEHGVGCTVHAPFADLSPGGFDKKIVAISRERIKRAVELAQLLEALGVVCHPGFDKWRFQGSEQLWLDTSIETWSEVLKDTDKNFPVMLENIFEDEPSTLLTLFSYFKEKNLWFCFDTGHFNLFSKISVEEWLLPLKDRLKEFHLHDNNGKSDEHLPIGAGTFPFRSLKQMIKQVKNPIFVLEPHSEAVLGESIQKAKEFLS